MSDVRKPDARETALEVLMQVDSANAWSDGGLKRTIAKNKLDSRDAALATRLCYGVIQNRMLLDYYIGCWCSQRPERLESVIRNILRLGGYQILFLDKVPPRAAVNEAVEMTKRHRREKAAGMVNAILRKFAANREDMPPLPKGSPAQTLSLRYSHPRWLVERLLSLIGEEETEAYLRMNNQVVPTTIQTNPLKGTPEELEKLLRQTGAQVEPHPWLAGCFSVSGTGDLEQLSAFREGRFTVQDAAARLVATVATPAQEDRVLDGCAAPGGKTTHLATLGGPSCVVYGGDIHEHKLRLIEYNAQKLGLKNVRTLLQNGCTIGQKYAGKADRVLVDAPCSGLGVLRHKIDLRWRKNPSDLRTLPALQRRILDSASQCVRPGGILVYSTCTMNDDENSRIVAAFLKNHPEFHVENATQWLPVPGHEGPFIQLLPQRDGLDGFFIARMKKEG